MSTHQTNELQHTPYPSPNGEPRSLRFEDWAIVVTMALLARLGVALVALLFAFIAVTSIRVVWYDYHYEETSPGIGVPQWWYSIWLPKHAIKTPADLKGLKIRVVGSPLFLDTFTALGANPTQMSWADAQPAMASGAVDGQENPLSIFTAAKLQNVSQKYLTLWGYIADPLIFVVNKDVWNSWTPADREAVRQAAIEAGQEEIALARKGVVEPDKPLLKQIEGLGVTVTQLTPDEREQFVKATRGVFNKWKGQIGADLVNQAEKSIAARKQ